MWGGWVFSKVRFLFGDCFNMASLPMARRVPGVYALEFARDVGLSRRALNTYFSFDREYIRDGWNSEYC